MTRRERTVDVLIVGGGPAGLGAGAELTASGAGRVEILEREQTAGGIPATATTAGSAAGPSAARGRPDRRTPAAAWPPPCAPGPPCAPASPSPAGPDR